MSDFELAKLAGVIFAAIFTGGGAVKWLFLRNITLGDREIASIRESISESRGLYEEIIQETGQAIDKIKLEQRAEFGGLNSKLDSLEKDITEDRLALRDRFTELYRTLPEQYVRQPEVVELRNQLAAVRREMQEGFQNLAHLIQKRLP